MYILNALKNSVSPAVSWVFFIACFTLFFITDDLILACLWDDAIFILSPQTFSSLFFDQWLLFFECTIVCSYRKPSFLSFLPVSLHFFLWFFNVIGSFFILVFDLFWASCLYSASSRNFWYFFLQEIFFPH